MESAKPLENLAIGILLASQSGGGALSVIDRLTPLLEAAGASVTLLTDKDASRFRFASAVGIRMISLPALRMGSIERVAPAVVMLPRFLRAIIAIRREARDRPELVLLPFLTGTALLTLAATRGLPNSVIVCERNDASRQPHGWHVDLLKRLLYPRATAITVNAPSQAARDHLSQVSRGLPVHFVPNPRPREIAPADIRSSRMILSVGRLVPQKRHATLIEAFAQVHARVPEWSVRIAGDGPLLQSLTELVEQYGLGDKIELAGHVSDSTRLYVEAGLFVLASDYEGTSNALLEAASAGLPCIVSNETAPPYSEGILMRVPAGSAEALAGLLLEVCTDLSTRQERGRAAEQWVRQVSDDEVISAWASALNLSVLDERS